MKTRKLGKIFIKKKKKTGQDIFIQINFMEVMVVTGNSEDKIEVQVFFSKYRIIK